MLVGVWVAGVGGAQTGATEGVGRMWEAPCAFGFRECMKRCYEVGCGREGVQTSATRIWGCSNEGDTVRLCCPQEVRLNPGEVDYMEFHATGTQVGDLVGKAS